jgi:hypothetical protein
MCRTHVTQHELSTIAPDFEWAQLFASLGFAHIRVGATSANIVVGVARTRTRARMHAASCAACTQAPAALKPSRLFASAARPPAACARRSPSTRAYTHRLCA